MEPFGWTMTAVGVPLERVALDPKEPGPGEVVVRVAGCGVCHTDLGYLFDGVPMKAGLPRILGHEIAGVVEAAGDRCGHLKGRSVIVPAVIPCGECDACRAGRSGICPRQIFPGNDIDGGFASHVRVPGRGLCTVDGGADLATLAVVADAVTTPLNAVTRAEVEPGSVAVVVGVGGIGGFAIQIAKARGAHVIALDVSPERLDLVGQHGADVTVDVSELDPRAINKELRGVAKSRGWPGAQWRIFETSGTAAGQATAFGLLNFGATLMVVGYAPADVTVRLSNLMAFDARALGVWGCPPALYPEAVALIEAGRVVLEPFVETRPMAQINEVLADIHARRIRRRVVLLP